MGNTRTRREKKKRIPLAVRFITIYRAIAIGLAYSSVRGIPGLTSSFVGIFAATLPFDLIVAMPKFSLRWRYWRELFAVVIPHSSATALTLTIGILFGLVFGGFTWLGLPVIIGAVLTVGLSYNVGVNTKRNISSYVGLVAGLTVFDQITALDVLSSDLFSDILGTALQNFYGTFSALIGGLFIGAVIGIITRLFLPRGYRYTKSDAYQRPLAKQPFEDVTHIGENMVLQKVTVGKNSPLAYHTLAETNLRNNLKVSVLTILRHQTSIVAPSGIDVIYPEDVLVVITPPEYTEILSNLVEGSEVSE